jgi:hypothetical protein
MIRIFLVEHDRDHTRTAYRVVAGDRVVGTAVELATDSITPWRLTIRNVCANLRRSDQFVLEQTIRRFANERPECFAPPPPSAVAWVPAVASLDAVAADLAGRGVTVYRAPMPPRVVEQIDPRPVLVAAGREV